MIVFPLKRIRTQAKVTGIGGVAETLRTTPASEYENLVCYAIENHPCDSRVTMTDDGIVQTLNARMGTGGGNVPMVLIPDNCECCAGVRENESIPDDHGSIVCEQPSGELHGARRIQRYVACIQEGK